MDEERLREIERSRVRENILRGFLVVMYLGMLAYLLLQR